MSDGSHQNCIVLDAVYAEEPLPLQAIPSLPLTSIGDALDTELEYVARSICLAIVILPKGLENLFSRLWET